MYSTQKRIAVLATFALCPPLHAQIRPPSIEQTLATFDRDPHPDLRGVVVLRDGQVIAERYYNGEMADSLHDVRSA